MRVARGKIKPGGSSRFNSVVLCATVWTLFMLKDVRALDRPTFP